MPLQRCSKNGKRGWKFGKGGTCYIGPGARVRAERQGRAIKADATPSAQQAKLIKSQRVAKQLSGVKLPPQSRQPKRQASGKGLERTYFKRISMLLEPYFADIRERLIPKIPAMVAQFQQEIRIDTYGETISRDINDIRVGVAIQIPDPSIANQADLQALGISDFQKAQLTRQIQTVLGINPIIEDAFLDAQVTAFVERNVALIKNIPDQSLARVETVIRTQIERGASAKEITALVQKELGIAKNRAKLIARDQTNKFMGKITELRQQSLGITEYTWSTSRDERVRELHRTKDGDTFSWDKPPADTGHPGTEIQCRCVAIPVLEELK